MIYYLLMNPDYYSDIKLAQRFIFESSIYLLNMFEKKIDSFIQNKTKQARQRERIQICHQMNIFGPEGKNQDPIKALSKDLTKPVWNCITKMETVALCVQSENDDLEEIKAMNHLFRVFYERYKYEHEDESNLKVQINVVKKSKISEEYGKVKSAANAETQKNFQNWIQRIIYYLLKMNERLKRLINLNQTNMEEEGGYVSIQLDAYQQLLLHFYEQHILKQNLSSNLLEQLYNFSKLTYIQIKNVIDSNQGPTSINYWPNLMYLPQIIHPMFLPIFATLKIQLDTGSDHRYDKDFQLSFCRSQKGSSRQQQDPQILFDELPQKNCSKIVFLNLDGYESPFNYHIAKYLSKYLQYISFPFEQDQSLQNQPFYHQYKQQSEMIIKQFVLSELSEQQKRFHFNLFKLKEKTDKQLMQYYKRLFIFPIQSTFLREKYSFNSIQFYQSKFIKFVFKQLLFIQIKQFNPSIIIISYSNLIHVDNDFFEELIKELTVLSNMRIILYNNLAKNYMFNAKLPKQMQNCQKYIQFRSEYTQKYQRRVNAFNNADLNYSIFDKISMFLKIASGTYTLDRTLEQDNIIQKYDIYKVQRYWSNLIKTIGKNHPVLMNYRSRCNQYLRLQKMLGNIYSIQKQEEQLYKKIPLYHRQLLFEAKKRLLELIENQKLQSLFSVKFISKNYVLVEWKGFVYRYIQKYQKEKEEQNFKYITRLEKQTTTEEENSNFIGLEFQILVQNISYLVNINKNSEICMKNKKQGPNLLVFLFNHLLNSSEVRLRNYVGVIDDKIQSSYEQKVKLVEVSFQLQSIKLGPFQHLARFNYFQTSTHIVLFWPIIYDEVQALLCKFIHADYSPQISNLILVASKDNPCIFVQVKPMNPLSANVIPRCGCTCFTVPNTNLTYIFGGFYTKKMNYLSFQVDITVIKIEQIGIIVQNVPKHFYFDYEPFMNIEDSYRITRLKQDYVRPRIEYEIYRFENSEDLQKIKIFVIGGVGQKFMRPYSMIGYLAHEVIFQVTGQLLSIRRIKLNNIVPVNLKKPIRMRADAQIKAICGIQNRKIYTKPITLLANTFTYSYFKLKYSNQQQKMTYHKQEQLGLVNQTKQEKIQNTVVLRQIGITARVVLRHYRTRQEVSNTLVLHCQNISSSFAESQASYLFTLKLELSDEVFQQFANLQSKQIPLIGPNIISIDVWGLDVYVILKHSDYTRGQYILGYCDLSNSLQGLLDEGNTVILLRQVYRFDHHLQLQALKALPDKRVAVLHSISLNQRVKFNQFILKKICKGSFARQSIYNDYPNLNLEDFLREELYQSSPISFYYINKNTLISWTFKAKYRGLGQQFYNLFIEELNFQEQIKFWKAKDRKQIQFRKISISKDQSPQLITSILDIRMTGERKFQIFARENNDVYIGNFDGNFSDKCITLLKDKNFAQYEADKYRHKYNSQYLQKIPKERGRYEELLEMETQVNQN